MPFPECLHVETPCIPSSALSRILGSEVYLKLENCQPTGPLKLIVIGALCIDAVSSGYRKLISSSGGNAGLAAAFSGKKLGVPTTVFVPESTPAFMREKISAEGAEVIVRGKIWDEA